MEAREALVAVAESIDERRWSDLAELLHPEFVCRYVHTGETFDRDTWVRLNAEYPGFDRLVLREWVADGDRGASRCHVTARDDRSVTHFEVAGFLTVADGLVRELTEVWTDVGVAAPDGTRP